MVSKLSVAEAKAGIPGLSLSDAAIQLAIDDVETEIVDRFGVYSPGPEVEYLRPTYGTRILLLRRRPLTFTSIVENTTDPIWGGSSRTLGSGDYRTSGKFGLERLATGTHPAAYWSRFGVTITYAPVDDTARRKGATLDVLKAEFAFSGAKSRSIGDYSESSVAVGEFARLRTEILGRLRPKRLTVR